MRKAYLSILLHTYKQPQSIKEYTEKDWHRFISQAYTTGMLGRFYHLFLRSSTWDDVPAIFKWHFETAAIKCLAHKHDIEIEISDINQALKFANIPPVYLKGAAYIAANDWCCEGRFFSVVDIYINKENIKQGEDVLRWHGWIQDEINSYDEQYYRRWMHELPPRHHKIRGTNLDIHHNLLPLTHRIKLNYQQIESSLDSVSQTLSTVDRVIHSATHLFFEEQFEKGIRDLSDIDLLIKQHSLSNHQFAQHIAQRAQNLGLGRTLFYAMRYSAELLDTPISADAIRVLNNHKPFALLLQVMDWLFQTAFANPISTASSLKVKFAHFCLYIRGHWLRMPPHLLFKHLFHKSFISPSLERRKLRAMKAETNIWK